jgi:hypothetical protein
VVSLALVRVLETLIRGDLGLGPRGLIRRDFRLGVEPMAHFSTTGLLLSARVRFAPHQPPPIAIRS